MRCKNCNTEVNKNEQQCPNCGAPLHNKNNKPTIGRGLVIFIIIGTIMLVGYGFFYYFNHKNDPKYTLTSIEPDSNLAEKNAIKLDTIAQDALSKDSLAEETVPVTVPSNPDGSNVAPSITSIAPTVSKPRVEKIEVR